MPDTRLNLLRPSRPGRVALLAASLVVLSGCMTVGPDYSAPDIEAPMDWSQSLPIGVSAAPVDTAALGTWWTQFKDPLLDQLIEEAVQGSLNLKTADARLREARARRNIASSQRFPTVGAKASRTDASELLYYEGNAASGSYYEAGFDATWEADLFGRVRRQIEEADAGVMQAEEVYRDVLVSLIAEVAINYTEVRLFQERIRVTQSNEETQRRSLQLVEQSFEAGEVARFDVDRARLNLDVTRAQIPKLQTGLEQSLNRLAILLGKPPGTLHSDLEDVKSIPTAPPEIAVGVPAAALRRRPDVRAAERNLAAQTAAIGVATADLYPHLSMSGTIGIESIDAGAPFTYSTGLFGLSPSMQWLVFDAGAVRRNIEIQSIRQEQALVSYESAVLRALNDVENALTSYREEQVRQAILQDAERSATSALEIANQQYAAGEIDYLIVLDAQRAVLSIQDQLAVNRAAITTSAISLFKALGGGWSSLAPLETAPAQPSSE